MNSPYPITKKLLAVATFSILLITGLVLPGGSRAQRELSAVADAPAPSAPTADDKARVAEQFGKLPLTFIENGGQLDSRVAYYIQGNDKTIYFTSEGLTFALTQRDEQTDSPRHQDELRAGGAESVAETTPRLRHTVKLDFVGARPDALPEGKQQSEAVFSYFKGHPDQWKTGLRSYQSLVYRDLWPDIDLVYDGTVNRMKYSFVVKPGADPSQIRLAYRGADEVRLNQGGELEVRTPAGMMTDERPVSYQQVEGRQVEVGTTYRLGTQPSRNPQVSSGNRTSYGFAVGEYDRSRELVIDPAMLVYCGYIGGSGYDVGNGIALDSAGNAYVTGQTASTEATFPVTVGPDLTFNGGGGDAFVAKVRADGTGLVYCGYIGGSDGHPLLGEIGYSIAVDSSGNAYVSGFTSSTQATFPVTVGPGLIGGGGDVFVAKVRADGTSLLYCGYIGGGQTSLDSRSAIAVDSAGNAYVTGQTSLSEANFPVTVGPDLTFNGQRDAFVAKVRADGTGLVYCGYIGGSGIEGGYSIAVDSAGNAYGTGITNSSEATFPETVGPDLTFNGGNDAFVAKVRADGTGLVYCGYIGGSGVEPSSGPFESGHGIAVDSAGNAYVTGITNSNEATFPETVGPDLTFNGGSDAFVAKVRADGTGLLYCGYIGGSANDLGYGIALDSAGNAYVTGQTASTEATFPVAIGPDLTFNGGNDAFVAKVQADGTGLLYCGYIGGNGGDTGYGIAVGSAGNAYVTGSTSSTQSTFPVTFGPDLTYNLFTDAFVAKVSAIEAGCTIMCPPNQMATTGPGAVECGTVVNYPAPTTTGSCSPVSCSPASGSCFPVGTTTVTCSTEIGTSCAFTVTVNAGVAATITVRSNADSGGTCPGGDCTLRQAIAVAVPGDTIVFDMTTVASPITLSSELAIDKNLTIQGPGASLLSISGNNTVRVFRIGGVTPAINVTLSGLTIANGKHRGSDGRPGATAFGGGILNDSTGTLSISNTTITGNSAIGGDSMGGTGGDGSGGGIYNRSTGTVNITNSTLSGNSAKGGNAIGGCCPGSLGGGSSGGGIVNGEGTVNLTNSTLSGNSATVGDTQETGGGGGDGGTGFALGASGGGITNSGTLNVTNCTLSGNSAKCGTITMTSGNTVITFGSFGGGISNSGTLNVTNSTLFGNSANGGTLIGIAIGLSSPGGGIFNGGGTLNVTCSTITGNSATGFVDGNGAHSGTGEGGGINNYASDGSVNARDTIIAGNTADLGPDFRNTFTSQGYNLIGNNKDATITPSPGTGDQIGTPAMPIDPLLGPLANNGGPTQTMVLLNGSPAIDKGGAATNPITGLPVTTDQRGFTRPIDDPAIADASGGDGSDIGALELSPQLSPGCGTFSPAAGMGMINVFFANNWTAISSDTSWLTITSGSPGSGNGVVNYSVAANPGSSRRVATININGNNFTVRQGGTFSDVPPSHLFFNEIGKLHALGITVGCTPTTFCPGDSVTREQMAAFIIRGLGDFNPPPPASQRFMDVPPTNIFYAFIEQMAVRQITVGCSMNPPQYCPSNAVTREQMAAFLIRALHESGYTPPQPASQRFVDVPPTNPFYAYIEELAVRGITFGCSPNGPMYCPSDPVTRGQMAAFLVRTFPCR